MRKYWAMKTFTDWWKRFQTQNIIGIDQEGVDQDYTTLNDFNISTLLQAGVGYSEYIDRIFREFCKWMHVGDLVIVGVGPTAQFNTAGIVRVSGGYAFDQNFTPRHFRPVEILKTLDPPVPTQRFLRTSRLELINEDDFYEALVGLI